MLHIPEKDVERAEYQAEAKGEDYQIEQGNPCGKQRWIKGRASKEHDKDQSHKGKGKVHKAREHVREGEEVFGDIDLFDEGCVPHDGVHALRCGLRITVEHNLANENIDGKIFDIHTKHIREHNAEDDHHEQGIEDSPDHAEERVAIPDFDIAQDKLS